MAKFFSLLSLFGTFLVSGIPFISSQDSPASKIWLVKEPEEQYFLVKKTPVVITCQGQNAAEIFFTCVDSRIPETSVEVADVSEIDPGLIQAKIEVTKADVQNYEGAGSFWCTCTAVSEDGQETVTSRKGYISVAFLKNKFTAQPGTMMATVKESVEIPCGAPEGHPKPHYVWKKDKKRLEEGSSPRLTITEAGNLRIQSVTVGDQGLYQCVVINIVGRHHSKGSTLKVLALEESSEPQVAIAKGEEVNEKDTELSKPRATRQTYKTYFTTEPQEKYYVSEDKPLLIDCSVVAADILTFRCNGKRMDRDRQTINQGLDASGNRNIQSQLRITYADVLKFQAEAPDSQTYQCICAAWFQDSGSPNGWGRIDSKSDLGFVHLAYLDNIFENEPADVTAAPGTDVTMICEPPQGEPQPWVYWYKDGSRLDPRSSNKYIVNARGHLMIRSVQQEDAGAYHCVVENVAKSVQSKVGTLTVTASTLETTTVRQSAEVDIPEFPEVIPSTPVFLRDFQPEYTVDRAGTRTMACAVISADQLTVECGGKRLPPEEFELQSKFHESSGKHLLLAKTDVSGESVAQNPDSYFCQCTAWVLNEQQSWDQVISARGYLKLGAARNVYIGEVFAAAPEDTDAYFEADAKLVCKPPEGYPAPQIHWLKDGVPIDPETDPNYVIVEGELIIEYVSVSDEGQYTCVAENEAGTRSSKPVQFTVLGKPGLATERPEPTSTTETTTYKLEGPFFSLSPEPEYYIVRDQPVNLTCTVVAATSLVFVCNGEVVQTTTATDAQTWDSNIQESINDNYMVVTKDVVELHTGPMPYTCVCRANYVEGDSEVSQNSYVDSSPAVIQVAFLRNNFLEEPQDTKVAYLGTAELVCIAPDGIPKPEVHWLKNGFRISRNGRIQVKDNGNLVISSFTEDDEGSYTCVAENQITSRTSRTAIVSLSDEEDGDVTKTEVGTTPGTVQPEPETTTMTVVQRPYFDTPYISKDLQPLYYLVNNKPVTITCEAYDVESITFTCGEQSVEDLNVFARVEQQVRSNGQSEPVTVFEASVNVSKEKVENYEAGKDYSCQCFAHYRVSATGEYKILNSTKAVVKIAYLNEKFEKEPESHIVTEGGFLTIFCNPPQGNPEPRVSWVKDGESFEAINIVQNNLLVFTETELEHTGEYICVAENEAGKRQSAPIMIEVRAKSDVSMETGETDAPKCDQMLSQCIAILPDSTPGPDTCLALPQHVSCIENYINNCREVLDEDTLNAARMDYEEIQVKCALQPKCPQLERCKRVSSARTSNHLTVAQFCKDDNTLSDCVDYTVAACNGTLSPVEEKVKSNLYKIVDWLSDFCDRLVLNSESLATCDEMMVCDLHIEQMATDNTSSWCRLMNSLVECTNNAVQKCQLNELRNDLEELHSDTRHVGCSQDEMGGKHNGPTPDSWPETRTSQPTTHVTRTDRISGNDEDDDDDGGSNEVTAIEGGAAASKEGSDNGSAILCMPVLLATILQLLTVTLYFR